ncbi:hypothetical protein [Micromonospora sp. NPDC005806]|uniref:hypothetical protein n=1 Tax=Micromonospora sp. NPDC005806 TaxID=3364234 RepID=UPI003688486F
MTTDPTFDPTAAAQFARSGHGVRLTRAQAIARLAEAEAAAEVDMARRVEEARVKHAALAQEAADARDAEVARTLATPPAELAAEVVARLRRRYHPPRPT